MTRKLREKAKATVEGKLQIIDIGERESHRITPEVAYANPRSIFGCAPKNEQTVTNGARAKGDFG